MKTQKIILTLVAATLTVWATGCKKEETSLTDSVKEAASDAANATKDAKAEGPSFKAPGKTRLRM